MLVVNRSCHLQRNNVIPQKRYQYLAMYMSNEFCALLLRGLLSFARYFNPISASQ